MQSPVVFPAAFPHLAGQRVTLSPMMAADVDALWEAGHHPELWRFVTANVACKSDMQAYVDEALAQQYKGLSLPIVIRNRAGEVVGSTRLSALSATDRRAELGWTWLSPSAQRTGINRECKLLVLTYAFETLGLERVELKADARNHVSRTAMLALGARQEGVHRHHMLMPDGQWRDTVYFSILAGQWPRVRRRLEAKLARFGEAPAPVRIAPATDAHRAFIGALFKEIVTEGQTYALDADTPDDALQAYWLGANRHCYVALSPQGQGLGAYVIKANQGGGGSHVANAAYMVHPAARGRFVAHALCRHSLNVARELGFLAMQFNLVVDTNVSAIDVWQDCGFAVIGTIPKGFRLPNGAYCDALIMHRALHDDTHHR